MLSVPTAANAAPDSTWDRLAECESGGNWSTDTGNGYSGGLQFSPSTWKAHGGTGNPADASRGEQIAVAERVLESQGWGAWPSCSKQVGASGAPDTSRAPEQAQQTAPQESKQQESQGDGSGSSQRQSSGQEQQPTQAPSTSGKQAPAPSQAPAPQKPAAVEGSGKFHTVKSGDTLESIAQEHAIEQGWSHVWAANLDTVSNPDVIEVGQVLELPAG